jgi:hypothetical protein
MTEAVVTAVVTWGAEEKMPENTHHHRLFLLQNELARLGAGKSGVPKRDRRKAEEAEWGKL